MVRLVAVAQATQDLNRVVDRGLVDPHLLEAPLESGVALQVLAVLVERRRADRLQLAAGERRLQDRRRVDRAFGRAGADEVMELVDEEDDVAPLHDLLHHLLQALLELAAVLGAGDERGEIERVDLLPLEDLGHLVRGDPGSESFDDGGLADARLADQDGIVLLAAREDLHHALDLGLTPDHGVELALCGGLRQVAAELVEELRALRLLAPRAAACALLTPARAGEHADDLVADLLGIGVEVEQDPGGDALVLADEAEQDVLGADVVVAEGERLAQRQLEHLLGARRERDLARRDLVTLADDPRDLRPYFLHGDVQRLENARGEPLLFAEEAEQDVLSADVVVLEGAGLVLSEDDDLSSPFRESLEHVSFDPPFVLTSGARASDLRVVRAPIVANGTLRPAARPSADAAAAGSSLWLEGQIPRPIQTAFVATRRPRPVSRARRTADVQVRCRRARLRGGRRANSGSPPAPRFARTRYNGAPSERPRRAPHGVEVLTHRSDQPAAGDADRDPEGPPPQRPQPSQ